MSDIVRKLATVEPILDIQPIDGADAIEVATIRGWNVVVKKGEYQVNDLAIYCEIDSWIPTKIAPFLTKPGHSPKTFEGVEGERLKTIRLRGQVSQGLILPLDIIPEFVDEGQDVTELLGIVKWELPVSTNLHSAAKGNWPSFLQKTDEERVQNIQRDITKAFESGESFEVTHKRDGSSMTVYYREGEVGVCSRNLELKLDDNEGVFVTTANKTGILEALKAMGQNIAVQGELVGPGVNGNRGKFGDFEYHIFNIWDINNHCYFTPSERMRILAELRALGFTGDHCPVIHSDFILPTDNISELLKLADRKDEKGLPIEGLVYKSNHRNFSFKAISDLYLLKMDA